MYSLIGWNNSDIWRTALKKQNSIHDNINSRLNSENACYHSVQNIVSSRIINKSTKTKICRTTILPVVVRGSETWFLTMRE